MKELWGRCYRCEVGASVLSSPQEVIDPRTGSITSSPTEGLGDDGLSSVAAATRAASDLDRSRVTLDCSYIVSWARGHAHVRPVWVHSGVYVGVMGRLWGTLRSPSSLIGPPPSPALQLITVVGALTSAAEVLLSTLFAHHTLAARLSA